MTMPDERLRAILWGSELLEHIATDTALPDTIIKTAQRIALAYPARQGLEDWLLTGTLSSPPERTTALADALALFDELRISGLGSTRTRNDLRYTLRHFPDKMTIQAMSRTSSMQEWLRRPANW